MEPQATPNPSRRVGYTFAIIFLIVFMIFINNLYQWNLPFIRNFLTPAYTSWLWAGNLSLSVAIFCNVLFLVYDPRWFKHMMQVIQNFFSLFSVVTFNNIFPLKLPSPMIEQYVHWGLLIVMALTVIGIIVEAIQAVTTFYRDNLKRKSSSI
jgi:hypothetical protein